MGNVEDLLKKKQALDSQEQALESKKQTLESKKQVLESKKQTLESKINTKLLADARRDMITNLFPKMNGNTPICCTENIEALLNHFNIKVDYNEMKREIEIVGTKIYHDDVKLNNQLIEIASKAREFGINNTGEVKDYVEQLAKPYHPVKQWILSTPWDGVTRLQQFYDTIVSNCPIKELLMRRWIVSAVNALFAKKPRYEGTLVFVGAQGQKKTTWLTTLVPKNVDWVCTGATLNLDDKDSILKVYKYWLVELGEIGSTFKVSDQDKLKAFLTNGEEMIRTAYSRKANTYIRRTVFFGTVNDTTYLGDTTGNRRYWTVGVDKINDHKIDIQQLWAEVYVLWQNGEQHWLDDDERQQLDEYNTEFEVVDPVIEVLEERIEQPTSGSSESLNITAIARHCGLDMTKKTLNTIGGWLRKNGFTMSDKAKKTWRVKKGW